MQEYTSGSMFFEKRSQIRASHLGCRWRQARYNVSLLPMFERNANVIPLCRLILLNKLLEDGNVLYRKSRLREAAHRYQYALKKFPADDQGEHNHAFHQLQINFLLNYSRCKRKLNVSEITHKHNFQSFSKFSNTGGI